MINSIYKINSFRKYQASTHLDFLRGIAALEVLLGHGRNLFFVDREEIIQKNILIDLLYFITGFGHQAVIIFFVLSGFFISSSVFKSYQKDRWSWKIYLINRLSRIEIVLIPAIILTYCWDSFGIYCFGLDGVYGGNGLGSNVANYNIADRLNPATLVGNILFLHNIFVPTFGSNGALWSLANEWWYYITFPLLLSLFFFHSRLSKKALIVSGLSLSVVTYLLLQSGMIYSFPIWLMGTGVCLAPVLPILNKKKVIAYAAITFFLILLGCILAIIKLQLIKNDFIADSLVGLATASLIYTLCNVNTEFNRNNFYSKISTLLSQFSYTLYLVHLPILIFAKAYLTTINRWQPNLLNMIFALLIILLVLIYAFVIYSITEANTEKVRYILVNHIKPRSNHN